MSGFTRYIFQLPRLLGISEPFPHAGPAPDLSIDHYRSFMSNVIVQNYYQAHPTPIYVMLQNFKDQTGAG